MNDIHQYTHLHEHTTTQQLLPANTLITPLDKIVHIALKEEKLIEYQQFFRGQLSKQWSLAQELSCSQRNDIDRRNHTILQ